MAVRFLPWSWVHPFIETAVTLGNPHAVALKGRISNLTGVLEFRYRPFTNFKGNGQFVIASTPWRSVRRNTPRMCFHPKRLRDRLIGPSLTAKDFLKLMPWEGRKGAAVLGGSEPLSFPDLGAKGSATESLFRLMCLASRIHALPIKYKGDNGLDAFSIIPLHGTLAFVSVDSKQSGGRKFDELMCPEGVYERLSIYLSDSSAPKFDDETMLLIEFAALCMSAMSYQRSRWDTPPCMLFGGLAFPAASENKTGFNVRFNRETIVIANKIMGGKPNPRKDLFCGFSFVPAFAALRALLEEVQKAEEGVISDSDLVYVSEEHNTHLLHAANFLSSLRWSRDMRHFFAGVCELVEEDDDLLIVGSPPYAPVWSG